MPIKMNKFAVIIALCFGVFAFASLAIEPKTLKRNIDGLVIPGELVRDLLGQELDAIFVMAERDGALKVIPFQIDEMTPDGKEYILSEGPKPNSELSDGVLSKQDEIALMAKDLGGRVDQDLYPSAADKVVEVEIIDPLDGTKAWCYVCSAKERPKLSDVDYVVWDPSRGEVRSSRYINGYPPEKNAIYFSRVCATRADGTIGEDFVDRMKMRFRFEALWGLVSFEGNEEQAGQRVLREKDGPVRVFRKGIVYYEMPFGVKYNAGGTLQIYWESFGQGPVELAMPAGVTLFLREAMMVGTTDYSPAAYGMRLFTDKDPEGVIIDGKMSEKEKSFDFNGIKWQCATGDQGSLCQRAPTNVPPMKLEDAYTLWTDDETKLDPPEEHPGMIGCLSGHFDLSALPPGFWRSAANFYTPPANVSTEEAQEYFNIDRRPLALKVDGKLGRSRILPWHPELAEDYYVNYKPLEGEMDLRE